MNIEIIILKNTCIAELISDNIEIKTVQDAVDIMGNSSYQGAHALIVKEENILPEFFDLKTRIAGDILQKFSTYNFKLAIIGDFTKYSSKSLQDFIRESNKIGRIHFVATIEDARKVLSK